MIRVPQGQSVFIDSITVKRRGIDIFGDFGDSIMPFLLYVSWVKHVQILTDSPLFPGLTERSAGFFLKPPAPANSGLLLFFRGLSTPSSRTIRSGSSASSPTT